MRFALAWSLNLETCVHRIPSRAIVNYKSSVWLIFESCRLQIWFLAVAGLCHFPACYESWQWRIAVLFESFLFRSCYADRGLSADLSETAANSALRSRIQAISFRTVFFISRLVAFVVIFRHGNEIWFFVTASLNFSCISTRRKNVVFDNLRELNVSVQGGFHEARAIISYNQVFVMSEFSRFAQQTDSRQSASELCCFSYFVQIRELVLRSRARAEI